MANLDNLIGSHLSLISQQDVRYDGILFSINAKESSIVLRDVKCLGTEDRVTDEAKKVVANPAVLAFVTFPGHEIKDLYVHEVTSEADTPPAPQTAEAGTSKGDSQPPKPPSKEKKAPKTPRENKPTQTKAPGQPQQAQQTQKAAQTTHTAQKQSQPQTHHKRENSEKPAPPASTAGTGAHLLRMREKKIDSAGGAKSEEAQGEFDFEAGLSSFNKEEVAKSETTVKVETKYVKDDFFDSLSCEILDRAEGRQTRMNSRDERALNQDTFGAIALQGPSYRRGGYRGGGRGGGGRGRGGRGYRGRGGGRGGNSGGGAAGVTVH